MNNFNKQGAIVTLNAPYAVASGDGALVGALFAVATSAYANAAEGEFSRLGEHQLKKAAGQAWTQGVKIYWDNAAKNCTTTLTANTLIGVAMLPAAAGDLLGMVLLDGAIR